MKRALSTLFALLPCATACDEPRSGDLDADTDSAVDLEDEADASTGDAEEQGETGVGGLVAEIDPQEILGGFVFDSDRDVLVQGAVLCSGTLLRNDVVLTARHCLTVNGTIAGPLANVQSFTVTQDGPGASLGAQRGAIAIAAMPSDDVAMLRLASSFTIEGRATGESTQIFGGDSSTLVGNALLCQGYGLTACVGGSFAVLRGGLMSLQSAIGGSLNYGTIPGSPWLQWLGDSGSSCRTGVFEDPRLRQAVGVQSTGDCGVAATEVAPEVYRRFAIEQMNAWAGGDFLDPFTSALAYEIDEPAGMIGGPSNWQTAGGVLTENSNAFTNGPNFEGTRFVNSVEVASDVVVGVTVTSPDNDAAGLVLRYRDPTHYYRLSFDEQRHYARIVRRDGDTFAIVGENTSFNIDWSTSPRIEFAAIGGILIALVDDTPIIVSFGSNEEYMTGRAGMYTWGLTDATFDDFEIERL